jgi:Glycosyl hydrolases family 25
MPSGREAALTRSVIDVSHWEYPIDFKKMAADGIVAVIAKATQGACGIDETYASYKEAAAPYKLLWDSYHFGTGSENAAIGHRALLRNFASGNTAATSGRSTLPTLQCAQPLQQPDHGSSGVGTGVGTDSSGGGTNSSGAGTDSSGAGTNSSGAGTNSSGGGTDSSSVGADSSGGGADSSSVGAGEVTAGDSGGVGTGEMAAGGFAGAADGCEGRHA